MKTFTARDLNQKRQEIREAIRANQIEFMKYGLTTIESNTPTWIHSDMRWIPNQVELFEVPYK